MIRIAIEKRTGPPTSFELKVDTSFRLNAVTRISGPSGVGKTTLLKMIAGFIHPDRGTIRSGDEVWFDGDKKYFKKVQERHVGFVFQNYALFPNMTVEQHLRYGTDDQRYVDELLQLGEIEALRNRYPKALSGGQQQRLAILRALATKPRLLLMDEPFTALDSALKTRLIHRLSALFSSQQTTVILVSHQDTELDDKSDVFHLNGVEETG
ncbi:ATP-binding cassette domain-containing protein [Pedobacter sp. BMA]|uniref:ATP-binding cassette domain-containing protein n=1 Tax=Pedobacter sp. BMA TaxID=1663685 RepID=UPI0006497B1D|nr:ATP-binding cassette domain-containing protein [Pedobacter sp. BMA]KLT64328.1 molybdenum ABC transporter ATP-binding protein [Pedobacter sp. BMA]